jgi:hypothetical protein
MWNSRLVGLTLVTLTGCGSAESPDGRNRNSGAGGQGGSAAGAGGSAAGVGAGGSAAGAGGSASGAGGTAGGTGGNAGSGGAGATPAGASGCGGSTGGAAGSGGSGGVPSDYFVGPSGDDLNPGTRQAPFKTLSKAHERAVAGNTIWVLPGTLQYGTPTLLVKSGRNGSPIRIEAEPGPRPVIDFAQQPRGLTSMRGIEIRGDYWHLKGLEIKNAGDNGILISGSNNVIEDVVLHHNDDTGLQIMASESQAADDTRAAGNLVVGCDSFENFDAATNGENADGFAAKLRIGAGNVFRNCRAWNNVDDGWDLFAADDVVVIENCWSFLNGSTSRGSGPSGDGNGFKLGGRPAGPGEGGAVHLVNGNSAFENDSCGFVLNNNPETPRLTQCGVADNGNDYCDLECDPDYTVSISGSEAKVAPRNTDGSLPPTR